MLARNSPYLLIDPIYLFHYLIDINVDRQSDRSKNLTLLIEF